MQWNSPDVFRLLFSFGIVVIGIIAVIILVLYFGSNPPATVGTGISAICTLVGFLAGHATGAAGKEKAEERASASDIQRNDVQDKLNSALAALPPADAKTIV